MAYGSVPQKIIEYVMKRETVSIEDVIRDLKVSRITAKNYLSRLARMGAITNIGRGLYRIGTGRTGIVKLPPELSQLAQDLRERFPMANFVIWSLNMLADYAHYTIGRDLIFIETSRMLSASIREAILGKEYRVVLNPLDRDFQEYAYNKERTVFILERKELYGLVLLDGNLVPTLERIWLDLFYFVTRRKLSFDAHELGLIFANMLNKGEVNFDRLLRYAGRRGLFKEILIFLYELKRESRLGRFIPEYVLFGRRETFDTVMMMTRGASEA